MESDEKTVQEVEGCARIHVGSIRSHIGGQSHSKHKGNLKNCHDNANWFWWTSKMNKLGNPCKETVEKVLIQACRLWNNPWRNTWGDDVTVVFWFLLIGKQGRREETPFFFVGPVKSDQKKTVAENWGPKRFLFGGHEFQRHDLQVQNPRGLVFCMCTTGGVGVVPGAWQRGE